MPTRPDGAGRARPHGGPTAARSERARRRLVRGRPGSGTASAVLAAAMLLTAVSGCAAEHEKTPVVTATATPTVSDGVQVFHVVGLRALRFSASDLVARPGRIRIVFSVENGSASHNFVIPKIAAARTDIIGAGGSQTMTFSVPAPGVYPIICTLHPNMTATLRIV
jgi:plastocyanin